MSNLASGALFAGYGGLDLAVHEVLGATPAWVAEIEPGPSRILETRFPDAPNLGDVTAVDWAAVEPVDIITGGSPCQDLSHAGKRAGMRAGTRSGLWASMCDAIETIRPSLVVWENVRGALSAEADSAVEPCPICVGEGRGVTLRALGRVLGDLAELGYDAAWTGLRAADVGAPHGRFRVFVLAWPTDTQGEGLEAWGEGRRRERTSTDTDDVRGERRGEARPGGADLRTRIADLAPHADGTVSRERGISAPGEAEGGRARPDAGRRGGAPSAESDGYGPNLGGALRLIPTPSVADVEGGRKHRSGARSGEMLLNGLAHARAFGQYAPAIARWEAVLGRPAPAPTEPTGRDGAHRLAPRFVEWMQGLADGWVTDVGLTRNEQLKALGNGVVPQQAAAAIRHLLGVRAAALAGPTASRSTSKERTEVTCDGVSNTEAHRSHTNRLA